jgi:hypothetical protein
MVYYTRPRSALGLDRGRNVHVASRFFPERHAPEARSFVVVLAVWHVAIDRDLSPPSFLQTPQEHKDTF